MHYQQRRESAHTAGDVEQVVHCGWTLRAAVELKDVFHLEPRLKLAPDIRSKTIAHREPDAVLSLLSHLGMYQISQ